MPDHARLVDLILEGARQEGVTPDSTEIMQIAGSAYKQAGVNYTAQDAERISTLARQKLGLDQQQGAASALAESAYRAGVVNPLGGIDARLGGDTGITEENVRANQQLQQEHPYASFAGGTTGSLIAPITGAIGGGAIGTAIAPGVGTVAGAIGGGVLSQVPYTVGNDVERQLAGRGDANRGAQAVLETGLSAVPGLGIAGRFGDSIAARLAGRTIEGATLGGGGNAGAQTIDYSTGDRQQLSASEALMSAVGGVGGAHVAHAVGGAFTPTKPLPVDIDAIIEQRANSFGQPADRGIDPIASPTDNGVRLPGGMDPALAQTAIDATTGPNAKRGTLRRLSSGLGPDAARIAKLGTERDSTYQTEQAQRDAQAQSDLDTEQVRNTDVQRQRDSLANDELQTEVASKKLGLPDQRTADLVAQARADAASVRNGEASSGIANRTRFAANARDVYGDNPDIPIPVSPERNTAVDQHAATIREQQDNRRRNETNVQADQQRLADKTQRTEARKAIKDAYQADRLDRRTAQKLFAELDNKNTTETRAKEIADAQRQSVDSLQPPKPTATELHEQGDVSGYETNTDTQDARAFDKAADTAHVVEGEPLAPKKTEVPITQVDKSVVKAPVEEAKPRQFFKNDLGKLTEVTDRIDPKHYEGKKLISYDKLSPIQQKQADTRVRTNNSRRGATLNPIDLLVAGAKGAGKGVRSLVKSMRHVSEYVGSDAIDRLKTSGDKRVNAIGEKLSEAVHTGKAMSRALHHESTDALRTVAAKNRAQVNELVKANEPAPANPTDTHANSKLYDILEGRTAATGYLSKIKDAITNINKKTADLLSASGVSFKGGASKGKNVVVRHFTNDARSMFQKTPASKEAFDNFVNYMVANNKKPNGSSYTPEEIRQYFAQPVKGDVRASMRLDPLEIGRKFPNIPQYIKGKEGWTKLIELDPTRYIHATVDSAVRRSAFHKTFQSDLTDILKDVNTHSDAREEAAAHRAIAAYNGIQEGGLFADTKGAMRNLANVKQVWSALRTTATAPLDATEFTSIVGQVPMQHAITGVLNSIKNRGARANAEGGIEADIKNLADLHSGSRQVAGNIRGFLQRISARSAVNRGNHILSYETGRAWGENMRATKPSITDEVFMNMNRIPDSVQERFTNGTATLEDSMTLGVAVAENMTGRKKNLAEQSRASRNEAINAFGPIFRHYAENRVRNLLRTGDAIQGALRNKNYAAAGRLFGERLTGLAISAGLATAIGTTMKYGIEGLQMQFEGGSWAPFVGNLLGGGVPGSVVQAQDYRDPAMQVASSLMWPVDGMAQLYDIANGHGSIAGTVPAVKRVVDATTKNDVAGSLAYNIFKQKEKSLFGSFDFSGGERSDLSKSRSDLRKALLSRDYTEADKIVNDLRSTMSNGQMSSFLRSAMALHKYQTNKDKTKLNQLADAMGGKAFDRVQQYDDDLKGYIRAE